MIYSKNTTDGYVKVASGACQINILGGNMSSKLGVVHTSVQPTIDTPSEFIIDYYKGTQVTLGATDCYIKVLNSKSKAVTYAVAEL